jgi:ABC-2 type transport system ATP-binding protein
MSSTADFAINVQGVTKTYRAKAWNPFSRGGVQALRGVDMGVHRGEVFGLLGPNGAGKSTLVKILMTVIRPTTIQGSLLGEPVGHKSTLARVGYLPEHHRFPEYLTARQVLEFYGALAKVPRHTRRRNSAHWLEIVGMKDWADSKVNSFSKGMRQRLGIANALVNDPHLVVLDEPTDGVDPVGRRDIRNVVTELKNQGRTVFLNSHLLSELELVCDRVAIMVQGKVWNQGTLADLTRDSQRYEITIVGPPPPWAEEQDAQARTPTTRVAKASATADGPSTLTVATDAAVAIQPLLDRLRSDQRTILSVTPVRESLEDLFMRAVTDPATGKALTPGAALSTGAALNTGAAPAPITAVSTLGNSKGGR